MKKEIEMLKCEQPKQHVLGAVGGMTKSKKEMYNEIHRKIDILNISISREEERGDPQTHTPQNILEVNQEEIVPKDEVELRSTGKKYKYIKPKSIGSMV